MRDLYVGSALQLQVTWTVSETPTDPTTVALEIQDPSGNKATYSYGDTDGLVTKSSTGVYAFLLSFDEAGWWTYEWNATGAVVAKQPGKVYVNQEQIDTDTGGIDYTVVKSYATLSDYKAWITARGGDVSTDYGDDDVIQMLLESTSAYIDRQTGRRFYSDVDDGTYYYQANDLGMKVRLPDFASITSVSVDFINNRSYTILTISTDYDLLPDNYSSENLPINGIEISPLNTYGYFPTQRRGVKIVGKKGWPVIPKDIQETTLSIAQNLYGSRTGQTSGGKVTVTAAGVVIRPEDVPGFAQKIIEHYRNYL